VSENSEFYLLEVRTYQHTPLGRYKSIPRVKIHATYGQLFGCGLEVGLDGEDTAGLSVSGELSVNTTPGEIVRDGFEKEMIEAAGLKGVELIPMPATEDNVLRTS
jgi:hypothetical protein